MSQGSLNQKIRFLGQKVCSVARGQTRKWLSDYCGHPFRISWVFPTTYHQGSAQYINKKKLCSYQTCAKFLFKIFFLIWVSRETYKQQQKCPSLLAVARAVTRLAILTQPLYGWSDVSINFVFCSKHGHGSPFLHLKVLAAIIDLHYTRLYIYMQFDWISYLECLGKTSKARLIGKRHEFSVAIIWC